MSFNTSNPPLCAPSASAEPPLPAGPKKSPLLLALSDIKIAHSVFALPFALLGAFLAAHAHAPAIHWPRFAAQLLLVLLCMVFARTWAMLVNRLADWRFDQRNPRTARRAVASGRLAPRDGWLVAIACAAAFTLCCALFWLLFANPWPLILALPVLAWIAFYSYTKRFTFLCHLFLGAALAASPIAAAIAIAPGVVWSAQQPAIFLLAAFVLLWVAGFDIAYALADLDFDRAAKLHSIPARLGTRAAIHASRALHALAVAALVCAWRAGAPPLGAITLGAVIAVAALLIVEHVVLTRRGVAGLPLAFFTINGVVSLLLGAAGITDTLL